MDCMLRLLSRNLSVSQLIDKRILWRQQIIVAVVEGG